MILVFGRSGSGKDFLTQLFGCEKIQSYTTREKRQEEINKSQEELTHTFVKSLDKVKLKKNDFWVARKFHYGVEYGATFSQALSSDIYVIDPLGVEMFFANLIDNGQKKFADAVKVVNIRSPFYRRFFRMVSRDIKHLEKKTIKDIFNIE